MEPALLVERRTNMRLLAAVAALLLATSACSGSESRDSPGTSALSQPAKARTTAPGAVTRETLTTPAPGDVLGRWRVVRVEGKRPPRHAIAGINMRQSGHLFWATWSDGLNDHSLRWTLTPDGRYHTGGQASTAVGCIGNCTKPSGFGVADAKEMRITEGGRLVFLDNVGVELARYRRVA